VGRKRLTGGLTSIVHRLTVERNGRREEYVLRWWTPDSEWEHWIARAVPLETAVLTKLERSDIPAPRVIGSISDAAVGGPAVLMTRLPGKVHLMPRDRQHWLRQMAQMLARIHALALDGNPFESWLDHSQLSPPPDASRADVWREAIALVAEEPDYAHLLPASRLPALQHALVARATDRRGGLERSVHRTSRDRRGPLSS